MKDTKIRIEEFEQEKKKKKKFSFKRLFAYIGVYVVLSFCFGFVIVMCTDVTSSYDIPKLDVEEEEPSSFAKLVNNLMSLKDFSTDVNLSLEENESKTFINGNIDAVLYEGYTGAEVKADLNISFNNEEINIFALYKNDNIYISINDYNYTFKASSFMSGVMVALQAFGIGVEGLEGILENFDMSILNDIESMLSEESFEDKNILTLKISNEIEIKIETDKNYNITNIYLGETNFSDIKLSFGLNLKDVNIGHEIVVPEDKNYVDITEVASLINVLGNTFRENKIGANIEISGANQLNGEFILDKTSNLHMQAKTSVFGKNIQVDFFDNKLFFAFDNLKLKANVQDFNDYLQEIKKLINIDLSYLESLVNTEKQSQILSSIFSLKEITKTDNTYKIIAENFVLQIEEENEKLSKISFEIDNNHVDINFNYNKEIIEIDTESYINAKNFLDYIEPIKNTLSCNNFEGNIILNYENESVIVDYAINFQDGLKALVKTSLLGIDVEIVLLNKEIFMNFNGIKIKADISDIQDLTNLIIDYLGLNLTQTSLEEILANEKLIQEFAFLVNGIYLKTFDAEFILKTNGEIITGFEVDYNKLNLMFNINKADNNNSDINVVGEYVEFKDVKELIKNTFNFINSNNYNFNINANFNGILINGYFNLRNNLINANAKIIVKNQEISLKIIENIVYLEFKGLKLSCDLSDIDKLLEFIEKEFNLNFNNLDSKINEFKENINKENIQEIIEKLILNYDKNSFEINYENYNLTINIDNNNIKEAVLKFNENFISIKLTDQELVKKDEGYYINIVDILPLISATKKTLENGYLSGDLTLEFEMFGESNKLDVNYGVSYVNNEISAYFKTNFKGLNVDVYYLDNTFFLNIVGLKIYLKFDEINSLISYVNSTFNTNINIDDLNVNFEDLSLDLVNNIENFSGCSKIYLKNNMILEINYSNDINFVKLFAKNQNLTVSINCTNYDKFVIENIDLESYQHYSKLTNIISNVIATAKEKQFNISCETKIYDNGKESNLNINLIFDISSNFVLFANVKFGEDVVQAYYINDTLYVKYRELKLCASIDSLKEILSLALQIIGVDPASVPFLDKIGEDINLDNIQNLVPEINFGNPLNMLKFINSMNLQNNVLSLNLNGESISQYSKNMSVKIYTDEFGVNKITLENIYTAQNTYFNASIIKDEFVNIPNIDGMENYIDISNSSKLLKSILNTTSLNDYQISGTISVVANVIGIDITMDIPLIAKIKLIDGEPIIYLSLDIPVIGSNVPGFTSINVNNDVPYKTGDTSVKSRKLEIFYKDGFVYFYRVDKVKQTIFASRTFEKKLMISVEELMNDPIYYFLQYGFGFSDTIMSEIDKAIEKSQNRETPLDFSKLLLGYANNSDYQTIIINLAELANNEMLDSATLNFYTTILNGKDYFSKLCFDIYMPIADAFKVTLKTQNLSLVNIGKEIDISYVENYISNYSYLENQMYEASNGNWSLASEKKYCIYFNSLYSKAPDTMELSVNSELNIPVIENFINDNGITKISYYFEGWYLDEGYNQKFSLEVMPRGDINLYAKWNVVTEYYRTITLLGGEDGEQRITCLEGEFIELPSYSFKDETVGDITTTYSFKGWEDENGNLFTANSMPTKDITLNCVWEIVDVKITKLFEIYDGDEILYSNRIQSGEEIVLPENEKINSSTKFYLDSEFNIEYQIEVMPENNLTIYVRNLYTLNIISEYGEVINSKIMLYQGENYSLPEQETYVYDDGEFRIDYNFNGYYSEIVINNVMPNKDMIIVADWNVVKREYFTISFDTRWYIPIGWVSEGILVSAPNEIQSVKVLQGDDLDLTKFVSTTQRKYTRISKTYTWKTESWGLEPFGDLSTKEGVTYLENIQSDLTLYACWYKQ